MATGVDLTTRTWGVCIAPRNIASRSRIGPVAMASFAGNGSGRPNGCGDRSPQDASLDSSETRIRFLADFRSIDKTTPLHLYGARIRATPRHCWSRRTE